MASSANAAGPGGVVPAQLGFLAIFNPSLGTTDETLDDQIVYYASVTTQTSRHKKRRTRNRPTDDLTQEECNERLRQIGLAQGMTSFSRGFAAGSSVDTIDTDKSRVVLHELEPGWWILASIDLTKVSLPPRLPTKNAETTEDRYEYSTRDMKPASLLLRDLLRAHSIFLMHHDSSLSALFVRSKRSKFIAILSRYWDLYLSTWNVMLHGNPIRSLFGGINLAASGELGVGVGEEERGSGEREVLEGMAGRFEGLVDVVVSRFGSYDVDAPHNVTTDGALSPWLGTGQDPEAEDGAIFLGTGALSRKSLRDVTHWMEDLYTWGDHAYGVIDSPTSIRRRKPRKHNKPENATAQDQRGISADLLTPKLAELQHGSPATTATTVSSEGQHGEEGKLDTMVSYLKLGYGTYWSLPGAPTDQPMTHNGSTANEREGELKPEEHKSDKPSGETRPPLVKRSSSYDAAGHYLIGLRGHMDEGSDADTVDSSEDFNAEHNTRNSLRTINVELEDEAKGKPEATIVRDFEHPASILTQSQVMGNMLPGYDSHDLNKAKKMRVVVYVNRPFIFVFLFHLRTDSLAWDSLYRTLHHQLAPLKKSLSTSTSYRPEQPMTDSAGSSIYNLVWDPKSLTVYSTIPNIPEDYVSPEPWSCVDAINTHLHLLNIHGATRSRMTDLERTQKTNRGWWVVWTRLLERLSEAGNVTGDEQGNIRENGNAPSTEAEDSDEMDDNIDKPIVSKEIFLIRRASDHAGFRSGYGDTGSDAPGRLAQGIGVDPRRYVEELLNLL